MIKKTGTKDLCQDTIEWLSHQVKMGFVFGYVIDYQNMVIEYDYDVDNVPAEREI